ncbi:uncharacterized protein [Triticum aestivum]|uniref:uncharacterized protein n=1 Tax=Triticum aestivum TaxID=4565 RepID=UPI001ABD2E40|nr:uncharacterized protein LOC120974760 [Aegilops tauschii subsp. strangulata]XP_044329312.1 uncharacterized protein LOC123050610 [Triticum aestivum]
MRLLAPPDRQHHRTPPDTRNPARRRRPRVRPRDQSLHHAPARGPPDVLDAAATPPLLRQPRPHPVAVFFDEVAARRSTSANPLPSSLPAAPPSTFFLHMRDPENK